MRYQVAIATACIAAQSAAVGQFGEASASDLLEQMTQQWYDDVFMVFFNENKDEVEASAIANLEHSKGKLLETCELGSDCRQKSKKTYKEQISEEWKTLIKGFKKDVNAQVLKTKKTVTGAFDDAVICEVDFPCCTTPETTIRNYYIEITNWKREVTLLTSELDLLITKRTEMETNCPEVLPATPEIVVPLPKKDGCPVVIETMPSDYVCEALTQAECKTAAEIHDYKIGGQGFDFASDTFAQKGCYGYDGDHYAGFAYFGVGGTESERTSTIDPPGNRISGTTHYDQESCAKAANSQGYEIGSEKTCFAGDWNEKGCTAYTKGEWAGSAWWGTGGTQEQMAQTVSEEESNQEGIIRINC